MKRLAAAAVATLSILGASAASAAFDGYYDLSHWTTTLTGGDNLPPFIPTGGHNPSDPLDVPVDTSGAPNSVKINGGDNGCGTFPLTNCRTLFSIVVQGNQQFTFHWDYNSQDLFATILGDASGDPFGLFVDSTFFPPLTSVLGGAMQSGDATIGVAAGHTFGFYVDCTECTLGPASVIISGFSVTPEPGVLALFGIAFAGLGLARRRARVV
jgi:hypothetical protein